MNHNSGDPNTGRPFYSLSLIRAFIAHKNNQLILWKIPINILTLVRESDLGIRCLHMA